MTTGATTAALLFPRPNRVSAGDRVRSRNERPWKHSGAKYIYHAVLFLLRNQANVIRIDFSLLCSTPG